MFSKDVLPGLVEPGDHPSHEASIAIMDLPECVKNQAFPFGAFGKSPRNKLQLRESPVEVTRGSEEEGWPALFNPDGRYRPIAIITEKSGHKLKVNARKGYHSTRQAPDTGSN
jgi:hypothetical protein